LLGVCASALAPFPTFAQTAGNPDVLRVGYQKGSAILVAARAAGTLQQGMSKAGIAKVNWIEFQFGPPMLEAITARAADLGSVGDTPPIFAQAGGGDIAYVLATGSSAHGIVVHKDSPIRSLEDLKGKRVAFGKGSSAHNVTLKALTRAGLSYQEIQPIYLGPAEAVAAFTGGKIDAWVIWDPYYALAEQKLGARVIADTGRIPELASNSFYVANRHFAQRFPHVVRAALDSLIETIHWADAHRDEVAALLAKSTGLDLAVQKRATDRAVFDYTAFTDEVLNRQQENADVFFREKLIPAQSNIRDSVWRG
jgi:sulfonate transport system substrate-binding protein